MLRLDARSRAGFKKLGKTLMPEASDHEAECNQCRYGLQDAQARIAIGQHVDDVRLLEAAGTSRPVVRAILATIIDGRLMLCRAWKKIHGRLRQP